MASFVRTSTLASFTLLSTGLLVAGAGLVAACATQASSTASSVSAEETAACDSSGTWALKITTPVKWPASFVLQAGTGTVTNWVKSKRVQTGASIMDTAQVCGVQIPDYQATSTFGSEKYGVRFPASLFDSPGLPTFNFTATLTANDGGAPTFTTGPIGALVGATMANPATDPWPSNGALLTQLDSDGDGKPGVSGDAAQDPGMSLPPVNAARSARANRVYTVFRQVLTATGPVTSCDRIVGKATTAVINNKTAIDSHVLGCRRSDNGADCSSSEYKLLDGAAPIYTATGDSAITMVRIPDSATCTDVRALSYDPPAADAGAPDGALPDASSAPVDQDGSAAAE
jgi:hypothetical protein